MALTPRSFRRLGNTTPTVSPTVEGTFGLAALKFANRQIVWDFCDPLGFEPTAEFNYGSAEPHRVISFLLFCRTLIAKPDAK